MTKTDLFQVGMPLRGVRLLRMARLENKSDGSESRPYLEKIHFRFLGPCFSAFFQVGMPFRGVRLFRRARLENKSDGSESRPDLEKIQGAAIRVRGRDR